MRGEDDHPDPRKAAQNRPPRACTQGAPLVWGCADQRRSHGSTACETTALVHAKLMNSHRFTRCSRGERVAKATSPFASHAKACRLLQVQNMARTALVCAPAYLYARFCSSFLGGPVEATRLWSSRSRGHRTPACIAGLHGSSSPATRSARERTEGRGSPPSFLATSSQAPRDASVSAERGGPPAWRLGVRLRRRGPAACKPTAEGSQRRPRTVTPDCLDRR